RGDYPGRVIIQTFNPDHYAVIRAKNHDCEGFYEDEIGLRKNLAYPPYSRLVAIQLSSLHKERGQKAVERFGLMARDLFKNRGWEGRIDIIGPAEAPLAKLRGRHRWHLLLKGDHIRTIHEAAETLREIAISKGLAAKVDVDPMNFM
ncbi:MAG: primosomal protein N', partial [Syntrophales bacterium]